MLACLSACQALYARIHGALIVNSFDLAVDKIREMLDASDDAAE